jgi:hypothetical protein
MIRAGRTTYFIDVKEKKDGHRFVQISQQKLATDTTRQRTVIQIGGESVEQFRQAINEAASALIG